MLGIPAYLYRLVPANPILLRVVSVGGKRKKDLFVRCAYLGLLIFIVIIGIIQGDSGGGDLDKLTETSTDIFVGMSYLQLALVALLAPIFTAGAITQEKDSQTYDILLSTPLTNGQIVLGTLLSRLFFVFALLVSGIPVFGVTQIFGGVAIGDILTSTLIAAVTALLTGAVAVAIATFKVGTRRTIFSFYMVIVIYLLGGFLLDYGLDTFHPAVLDPDTNRYSAQADTSWLTGIHPFLALRSILDPVAYAPPSLTELRPELRGGLLGWYFTQPATFFITAGTFVSLVLVIPSVILLRRMAQSTLSFKGWLATKLAFLPGIRPPGPRAPRGVWNNPIAWREAKTKASATRAGILRYAFIGAGLIGAFIVAWMYSGEATPPGRFVDRGSYNDSNNTLFIKGDNERIGLYGLSPTVTISVDGSPASRDALAQRYAVTNATPVLVNNVQVLNAVDLSTIPRSLSEDLARKFLLGMVFLEVAVILLIVTNAAASTVTREREDGALDLLLSTPITSRYYIWGKLRGLVAFSLPLIFVPVASCTVFVIFDILATASGKTVSRWMVLPEAIILVPLLLIVLVAFASIVGMRMSLSTKTTVRSVMVSLAIVIGLFAVLGWCGTQITSGADNPVVLMLGSFSPLTVIMLLIDPQQFGGEVFSRGGESATTGRISIFIFSLIACGAYAAGVWALYRSMVKNFDMTIRRQQR